MKPYNSLSDHLKEKLGAKTAFLGKTPADGNRKKPVTHFVTVCNYAGKTLY